MFAAIRHAIARYRFNRAFGHFDQQAEECRRKHKRGVLEATAAKRRAVNMALAGRTRVGA
jgi:hypothetical protein